MGNRMMVLVNPNAGRGGYKAVLGGILETFCMGGWEPTLFFTRGRGDAPRLVAERAAEFDMVTCMGGDGTLSEVCGGMVGAGLRVPIGYIPLGTSNDVSHTLGLSAKPLEAAKTVVSGSPTPYDVGQFGPDRYFTYIAAFGAFTEVSYETPQDAKQALGHLAYLLEGLSTLTSLNAYHALVEHDGGTVEGDFVFGAVTNSTSVAGMVKLDGSAVDLSDGQFEVLLVKTPRDLRQFGVIISAVLSGDLSGPNVLFFRSSRVRVDFDQPVAWTRDGEDGGKHRSVEIQNLRHGVEIII